MKSKKTSSSHSAVTTTPSTQEVALRVASCNLRVDLSLEKYDSSLHVMLEFLKSHPIHKPLTKSITFPLSVIHTAYSSAIYNSEEEYIQFDVDEDSTIKLCKVEFLKAIGLPESKEEKTFYEPTTEELIDVFDQMGYLPPRLERLVAFKKGKLPAMWQFLVHIILRCLTGKTGGTDTLSRAFLVFLFGIYTGKEVDFGTTIWKDFASYVYPKKKEIPCARFWALALHRGYTKLKVPLPQGEKMFTPSTISRYIISNQSDFKKVARLPEAMLQYIEKNSEALIKHRAETLPPELEHHTQSSQPIKPTKGYILSPKIIKQSASNVNKTTGLGTKRKYETIAGPEPKKRPTQSIPISQKVKDVETRPTFRSQSSTPPIGSSSQADDVSSPSSQEQPSGTHSQLNIEKLIEKLLKENKRVDELNAEKQGEQEDREKSKAPMSNEKTRKELEKKEEERKELVRMLREEQKKREEEEWVRTADKLLKQSMSLGPTTKIVEESVEDIEEDFVFTNDDGLIQDSDTPSIIESDKVKPSKSKVYLGTSETDCEHIEEAPKGETNTLPTNSTGASTPRRRTKWKKKKKSKYISRVEFKSLNQKLSEVLEVVKKIPPPEERFVSKEDFGEMQKIVTSLAQSVPSLETTENTLRESIINSNADTLREMEQKRTDDTFKYLDRMDEMVKTVKEIQQSYDDLTNTMGHQHGDEIVRLSEQLCDYRNRNIILQAVLVKVMQSAQQLLRPSNVRFDEVLFAIQKVQNSVVALPKTLSSDELGKQVQQSFLKVFELIEDLKGSKFVDEAGFSSTKGGEDENVVIAETSEDAPSPKIDEVSKPQPPPPPAKIKIPTPSTSFIMPSTQIAPEFPETPKTSIKDKGKTPLQVSEVSGMKTLQVSEEDKKRKELEDEHTLTLWVNVIRQLRDDELVPKQTTAPPICDDYQWDIPMSPNARYNSVFQPLHPHLSREMQMPIELDRLEKFFKANAQAPKDVWSLRRIIRVLGYKKKSFQKKEYFGFEVLRSDNKEYYFSEADFPNLNPNDLYMIGRHFQNKLLTHEPSRFPFVQIQRFLRSLIYDLGSIDAERFNSFVDNPPEEINQDLEGIENRHRGPTDDPELGIIFSNEKDSPKLFFRLKQKHRCTTEFLEKMIDLTLRSKKASAALKVKIIEELEWWVAVRKWIKRVTDLVTNKI